MAKKKGAKKERKRKGRPTLTEEEKTQLQLLVDRLAAQDPQAESFAQYVESLKPLVQRSTPFTLAFIETLGATTTPVSVKVLQTLEAVPVAKEVRRALKTALYRLARQGLVVEEEKTESAPRVLVPRPADRQAESWASWPESRGERGIVLKLPDAGRGYLMAVTLLDSQGAFHELDAFQTTRKGVRELLEAMTGGEERRLISIPLSHFRFLFEEAAEIHEKQNRELPAEYEVIQKALSGWVEPVPQPDIHNRLDVGEITDNLILLRSSDSLLELLPFKSWHLHEDLAKPFADKIKGLTESRLVVSQAAQTERRGQIIREAAAELFTSELRERYRRLLEEAALLLYLNDQLQEAKRALAVAIELEHEVGLLSENTFILGLVQRSVETLLELDQKSVEPGETGEERTESGIIIPR
jgi:hypothetical protein